MTLVNILKACFRYMSKTCVFTVTCSQFIGSPSEAFLVVDDGLKKLVIMRCDFIGVHNWKIVGDGLLVLRGCTFTDCEKPKGDRILHIA